MALFRLDPVPSLVPVLAGPLMASRWVRWFGAVWEALAVAPARIGASVALAGVSGATAATAFDTPALAAGLYRVSAYTTGGAVVTVGFTVDGVASSVTVAGVALVPVDAETSVTYAIADPGVAYDARIVLERVE